MRHLYKGRKQLNAAENFELSRRVKAGDLRARNAMIEGNSGLAYRWALKCARMNQGHSNIEEDDILSSALLGLTEAVDRYDPEKGFAFSTYAPFWIRKCLNDNLIQSHWNTVRPPKTMIDDYMQRRLDDDEIDLYQNLFISRSFVTENSKVTENTVAEQIADIRRVMRKLSPMEQIVMSAELGDVDPPEMSDGDYADALASAFDRLRELLP